MTGRTLSTGLLLHASTAVVLAFLMLPILAVVPASLSEARFIRLPPEAYTLDWYGDFLSDGEWRAAFATSVQVAAAVTVLSVVLGTAAALGLRRVSAGVGASLLALFLAPLIVPVIVTAVAVYRSALDVQLNSTFLGVVLGHSLIALPFVIVNVGISLRGVERNWLKAAEGLGADPLTIFRTVTLPNILPGMLGGAIFAFVTSFDEITIALFMTGAQTKTLPVQIWEHISFEFTPVVAVAATLLIVLALLLIPGIALANSLRGRRAT